MNCVKDSDQANAHYEKQQVKYRHDAMQSIEEGWHSEAPRAEIPWLAWLASMSAASIGICSEEVASEKGELVQQNSWPHAWPTDPRTLFEVCWPRARTPVEGSRTGAHAAKPVVNII